jgi:predicted nucleic acid-binding protein
VTFGLDTSVVLRLILGEPVPQAAVAKRRLERAMAEGDAAVVSDLVITEAYHALCHHYGVPKDEARRELRMMLTSGVVALDPRSSLWALDETPGAGLFDRLVVARYRDQRVMTWTFDRKLAALEGAERLRRG